MSGNTTIVVSPTGKKEATSNGPKSVGLREQAPPAVSTLDVESATSSATPSSATLAPDPVFREGGGSTPRIHPDVQHLKHLNDTTKQKFESIAYSLVPEDPTAMLIHGPLLPTPVQVEEELMRESVKKAEVVEQLLNLYDVLRHHCQLANLPLPSVVAGSGRTPMDSKPLSPVEPFTPKPLDTGVNRVLPAGRGVVAPPGEKPKFNNQAIAYNPTTDFEPILSYCNSLASMARQSISERHDCEHGVDDDGNDTINNFTIISQIGKGMYGKVYLAVNDADETFAIKTMDCGLKATKHRFGAVTAASGVVASTPRGSAKEGPIPPPGGVARHQSMSQQPQPDSMVLREIAIMKKLHHENVVQLKEVIHDDEEDVVHLVMQYIDNGPIATVQNDGSCQALPPEKVKKYFYQAAKGLAYLHRKKVIHRDLKPENILLSSNDVCYLADFGVSAVVRDGNVVDIAAGTQTFFSPEICSGDYAQVTKFGAQSDIWALGVTIYAIRYGKVPFYAPNFPMLMNRIQNTPLEFPDGINEDTDPLVPLLRGMLEKDPSKRLSLPNIICNNFFDDVRTTQTSLEESVNNGVPACVKENGTNGERKKSTSGGPVKEKKSVSILAPPDVNDEDLDINSDSDNEQSNELPSFTNGLSAGSRAPSMDPMGQTAKFTEEDDAVTEDELMGAIKCRRQTIRFAGAQGHRKSMVFGGGFPMLLSRPGTEEDLSQFLPQGKDVKGAKPGAGGVATAASSITSISGSQSSVVSAGPTADVSSPFQGNPMRMVKHQHAAAAAAASDAPAAKS